MKVEINRKKALLLEQIRLVHRFLWKLIFIFVVYLLIKGFVYMEPEAGPWVNEHISTIMIWLVILGILQTAWGFFDRYRYFKTLVYEFEGDKHTESYQIITKTRVQARTQVVNDIQIYQDLFEKFFGFFSLTVSYGFGGGEESDYTFIYNFLTEKQALELEKKIKTKGRITRIR